MTIGEDRVRIKFNPSDDSLVAKIKQKSAELIDLCEEMRHQVSGGPEMERCLALAMTHYEDAAMWAVKAATASATATSPQNINLPRASEGPRTW